MTIHFYRADDGSLYAAWNDETRTWQSIREHDSIRLKNCVHCGELYDPSDVTIGNACTNENGHSTE